MSAGGQQSTRSRESGNPAPDSGIQEDERSGTRHRLARFVRTLRDNGFKAGLAETCDAVAILAAPPALNPSTLKPALRSLFCATHSDWQRFDEIFDAFWQGRGARQARALASPALTSRSPARHL